MARGRPVLDGAFFLVLGVLVGMVALAWARGGPELVLDGLGRGGRLLLQFSLVLCLSFLAAGLSEVLVPREWIGRTLGEDSGLRGILLATGVGALTPAGPFVAFPMAAVLRTSGAGNGPLVAYVVAWSLIALHRFIAFEIPILGGRFAALRYGISLGLPVLAGLAARALTRP